MIQVEKLTKHFGPVRAVDGIDFHVGEGEVVGFLGPNGAGKSTTIRMLTCYLPPTAGKARVAGFDIYRDSLQVRSKVGYLPETVPLYPEMRVREFLRFRAALKGVAPRRTRNLRVEEVMELCGVVEVARKLVGHVSRGYRQRVGLAEALVGDPPILVLDEPTSGLDPNQRRKVKDLVRVLGEKRTVLFSSHILAEVEQVCSRVIIIHQGRIVGEGTREELIRRLAGGRKLLVEADGPPGELLAFLGGLPGCSEPRVVDSGEGFTRVQVPLEGDLDPRVKIYTWARERGKLLKELALAEPTLEEIFAKLTLAPVLQGGEAGEEASR